MPSLAEKDPLGAFRILLFSMAGAGKTHLLGTFTKAGKLAIADTDTDGVDTLLGVNFRKSNPWFKPELVEYQPFEEPMDLYGMPKVDPKAFFQLLAWLNKKIDDPSIRTIAVDSLTTASILATYAGMRANEAKGRSKTWSDREKLRMLLNTMADFGAEMNAVGQLINVLRRASTKGKHVIVTAHTRENRSESGVLLSREPLVTGDRLRAAIALFFSDVWFLDVVDTGGGNYQRKLITDTTSGVKAVKSRLGVPTMLDPSYEKIIAQLRARGVNASA